MSGERAFFENFRIWIYACKWLGLFPYDIMDGGLQKNKYFNIHIFRAFVFCMTCAFVFSRMVYVLTKINWLFIVVGFNFMLFWLIFWWINNKGLIEIFSALDRYDNLFKTITRKRSHYKKMFQLFSMKTLAFLFFIDGVSALVMSINVFNFLGNSRYIFGIVGAIERSAIFLFILLYLYLIYCLKYYFEQLYDWWHANVNMKLNRKVLYCHLNMELANFKFLYNELINIVELMNNCLGSRFIIMFAHLFFFIVRYLYLVCIGSTNAAYFSPFYIAVFLLSTLWTQSFLNSADFVPVLLKLPADKMEERCLLQARIFPVFCLLPEFIIHINIMAFLFLQVYGLIQQLRRIPFNIHAKKFFTIDQQFAFSITTSAISYLIAFIQLGPLVNMIITNTTVSLM